MEDRYPPVFGLRVGCGQYVRVHLDHLLVHGVQHVEGAGHHGGEGEVLDWGVRHGGEGGPWWGRGGT